MKKLLAIVLMFALAIGATSAQTKRTSKAGTNKSRTTKTTATSTSVDGLSFEMLCKPMTKMSGWQNCGVPQSAASKIWIVKPFDELDSSLTSAGFKRTEYNKKKEFNDQYGEYVDVIEATYDKSIDNGLIMVVYRDGDLQVQYPDRGQTARFLSTIKAKGYVFNKTMDSYIVPANSKYHWIGTRIEACDGCVDLFFHSFGG